MDAYAELRASVVPTVWIRVSFGVGCAAWLIARCSLPLAPQTSIFILLPFIVIVIFPWFLTTPQTASLGTAQDGLGEYVAEMYHSWE